MTYDLIIVSSSTHKDLIRYTQQAIDTCCSEGEVNVILVETGQPYKYKDVNRYIEYNGEFNYNRALNMGLKYARSDFQILANNDIIFHPGWSKIGDIMRVNHYLSASALSNDSRQKWFRRGDYAYEGYFIGWQLAGWCIFTDKALWNKIGKLSERHTFWFSDNVYGEQLKAEGIPHALICSVHVDHIGSQTLKKLDSRKQLLYTIHEGRKIKNANSKAIGKGNPKDIQKKLH